MLSPLWLWLPIGTMHATHRVTRQCPPDNMYQCLSQAVRPFFQIKVKVKVQNQIRTEVRETANLDLERITTNRIIRMMMMICA
jgi:hypothetical protein